MKFTSTLISLAFTSTALAAPVSTAADAEWTFVGVTRTCDAEDTTCSWQFGIDTGAPDVTPCSYVVNATATDPASEASGGPTLCGAYTITSGWSGQFGPGQGFTTLSVVDSANKLIAYPAYTDTELDGGVIVSPDRSYPVQTLA
ncbi:hypothetical protein BJ170DRAFT_32034 [Xylariales sp. AK1849]|nr:hypothetical protein BJ170DRAFT_32034 [Xylariales sp. AK1849]